MLSTTTPRGNLTAVPYRVAGGAMILLGLANLLLGVLSLAGDAVRLSPAAAGGLLVAGSLTIIAGWIVWQGSRAMLGVALSVFVVLLILQLGEPGAVDQTGQSSTPRLIVLGVVIAVLGTAWALTRRPRHN